MNTIYRLFDEITEKIPLTVILYIRLTFIVLWVLIAGMAVYVSWDKGASSAAPSGQDLYMSEIREQATREKNLSKPPSVVVPDLGDLAEEKTEAELPRFDEVIHTGKDSLPPYLSEKHKPDQTGAFLPEKNTDPEMRRPSDKRIDLDNSDTQKSSEGSKYKLLPAD